MPIKTYSSILTVVLVFWNPLQILPSTPPPPPNIILAWVYANLQNILYAVWILQTLPPIVLIWLIFNTRNSPIKLNRIWYVMCTSIKLCLCENSDDHHFINLFDKMLILIEKCHNNHLKFSHTALIILPHPLGSPRSATDFL